MSASFAAASRQLAGQSALLLGWRPPEFWAATPAELAAIFAQLGAVSPPAHARTDFASLMERHPDD